MDDDDDNVSVGSVREPRLSSPRGQSIDDNPGVSDSESSSLSLSSQFQLHRRHIEHISKGQPLVSVLACILRTSLDRIDYDLLQYSLERAAMLPHSSLAHWIESKIASLDQYHRCWALSPSDQPHPLLSFLAGASPYSSELANMYTPPEGERKLLMRIFLEDPQLEAEFEFYSAVLHLFCLPCTDVSSSNGLYSMVGRNRPPNSLSHISHTLLRIFFSFFSSELLIQISRGNRVAPFSILWHRPTTFCPICTASLISLSVINVDM